MTKDLRLNVAATCMQGDSGKAVFFRLQDLPEAARVPAECEIDDEWIVIKTVVNGSAAMTNLRSPARQL